MKKSLFTLIALLLFISFNSFSAKWRVNNTPGVDADYTSFKQAHDAVSAGDTLMFECSSFAYGDKDTLSKQLAIIGPGYFLGENDTLSDQVLPAFLNFLYVDSAAKGSVIMGMSFFGAFDCLQLDADDLIISRNHVKGCIALCYFKPVKNVVISKNFIYDIDTRWSSTTLFVTNALITNNIIKSEISLNGTSSATIMNNTLGSRIWANNSIVKNNISSYLEFRDGSTYQYNLVTHAAPAGVGNVGGINWDDLFVTEETSTDGEYILSETSPAKGAGESGADCGAFGGNSPYILSGYPPFPVIFNADIPSNGTDNLLIKIEARSQN